LRDEDLFKFLQDPKRPCSVMKKLKCIPGILKLDISPCPDEPKNCLTPELVRLQPYPGKCVFVIGMFNDSDELLLLLLNLGVCILLRVLDQVQGFPSNATLFQ
jgi:hypothetical protein